MGISATFVEPFYSGGSTVSGDVPAYLPVAIAGHSYLIDLAEYDRQSIDVIRQPVDDSDEPSERTLNPAGLWPRSIESWHHGAGQTSYDLEDSDRRRFRASKGIDVWTPGKVCLLNDTASKRASVNTNLKLAVAGSRLYAIDGQQLLYTTDISGASPTWTAVTGTPAATALDVATDGYRVWVAYGASGLYQTNTDTGAASALGASTPDTVDYCNGRLVTSDDDKLYEVDAAGVATLLYDHAASAFRWDAVTAAPNAIYAAGHAGTNGEVYRVTMTAAGTALGAPTAAAALPDGEYVTAIAAYVGVIVLGTNKGVRLAAPDTTGNLTYGPLVVSTGASVTCLEGEDRFVWFGWTNYDTVSTGLGRLDLALFTGTLRPAYASDLMVTAQGAVLDVATFQSRRVFTVSGSGIHAEIPDDPVASGTVESGLIRWGTTVSKTVHAVELRTDPIPTGGSVAVALAPDDGTFETLATFSTLNGTGDSFSARNELTEKAEVRLTLAGADVCVGRVTAKALVAPSRSEFILVPIILHEIVENESGDGQYVRFDTDAEFAFLKGLEATGLPITYQEGALSWTVTVERVRFRPSSWTENRRWFNGTCSVLLKTLEG